MSITESVCVHIGSGSTTDSEDLFILITADPAH